MKIIDFHAHLGDVIFGTGAYHPYEDAPWTPGWITEITGYRTSTPPPGFRTLARYLEVIHNQERNNMATLQNLVRHSLPYGIGISVLQPIEPARPTRANLAAMAEYKSSWRATLASCYSVDKIGREGGVLAAAGELADNAEPPLKLLTFCSVHPKDPDKENKLKSYCEAGCMGIKLHPIIQDLPPEDPAWMEVFELWRGTGKPALLHSGVSGYFMPRSVQDSYGEAARYERWISSFPDIRFVLAHMNMIRCEVVWDLAQKYDNVLTDCSFHSAARIRQAKKRMGIHRLLFASDFPFSLPKYAVKVGMEATMDDLEFRAAFFNQNAAELLNLKDKVS